MASRVGTAAIGIRSAIPSPFTVLTAMRRRGERTRPDGDGQAGEVTASSSPRRRAPGPRRHQALGVRDAHVEQVLGHGCSRPEQRHPAGARRGFDGQQAHTAGSSTRSCDNGRREGRMTAVPKKDPAAVWKPRFARRSISRSLKRTGASPRQRSRAVAVRTAHQRVHREDARHDGAVVHRRAWAASSPSTSRPGPVDAVPSTGHGALILSHCVARAHPSAAGRGVRHQGRVARASGASPSRRVPAR